MAIVKIFASSLFAIGLSATAVAQDMSVEELERMIEELDRAIEQTDGLIEQANEGIGEADQAIEGIDQTLQQAAPYAGMAAIPLIGADGGEIAPQVGQDFEEALWCLNGLDLFSQLVSLDDGEMAIINSGMDFFAGVALGNGQALGLNDDVVRTMLVDDRANVADELETRPHEVNGTMLDYCVQMATLYYDLFAQAGG